MKVRQTGCKRGQKPTYYIQADTDEEKAAIKAGLLDEIERRLIGHRPYVLAYGFKSRHAAEEAMDEMYGDVAVAVRATPLLEEVVGAEQAA
jgi:hypothetical protein